MVRSGQVSGSGDEENSFNEKTPEILMKNQTKKRETKVCCFSVLKFSLNAGLKCIC